MIGRNKLHTLLKGLAAAEAPSRDLAAAELGDLLEADQLEDADYQSTVNALLRTALAEADPIVRESKFNALSAAATRPQAASIDWHPLAERLPELTPDCLEHALLILGLTADAGFLPQIEPLLHHPDKAMRRDAAATMKMLGARVNLPRLKSSMG